MREGSVVNIAQHIEIQECHQVRGRHLNNTNLPLVSVGRVLRIYCSSSVYQTIFNGMLSSSKTFHSSLAFLFISSSAIGCMLSFAWRELKNPALQGLKDMARSILFMLSIR